MVSPADELQDILRSFNLKERYYLIGTALGSRFRLSWEFIDSLNSALGVNIPGDAFAAMDYHLDWIYASLVIASLDGQSMVFPNTDRLVTGTQEDIDFLIAYRTGEECHIILLEAKGVTSWTNRQMKLKADRLGAIFGPDGRRFEFVVPHFALISPRQPERLKIGQWPAWMRPGNRVPWIHLPIPRGLRRLSRCDEQGRPDQHGAYWTTGDEGHSRWPFPRGSNRPGSPSGPHHSSP